MKRCVDFLLTMMAMFSIIFCSRTDYIHGDHLQETNDSSLLKIRESLLHVSINEPKDPDQPYENYDLKSTTLVLYPDMFVDEKSVHKTTLTQSSKTAMPRDSVGSRTDGNSFGLILATGLNRKSQDARTGEEVAEISVNTHTLLQDASSYKRDETLRSKTRTSNEQTILRRKISSDVAQNLGSHETKNLNNAVHESTQSLTSHGVTIEEDSSSNSTRNSSYQQADSQDNIGLDSDKSQGSHEPKIEQDIFLDSRHNPFSQRTTNQVAPYPGRSLRTNSNYSKFNSYRLPKTLKTRIAITNYYDQKLLQGYIDVSAKSPNDVHRNPQADNRSITTERTTLKSILAKAKNGTAQLIADHKALRNGYVWNDIRHNPNFKSFFEKVSASRTAYENAKRAKLGSLAEFLVKSNSPVNGAADERTTAEDAFNFVRSEDPVKARAKAEQRLTTESFGDGQKSHKGAVKMVKRDAAAATNAARKERKTDGTKTAFDIGSEKRSSGPGSDPEAEPDNSNSTEKNAKKSPGGIIIPILIVASSVVELIVATLVLFKDKIFAKRSHEHRTRGGRTAASSRAASERRR